MDSASEGIWWGENLAGARQQPVLLKDMTKLVYSPHTYGPSVYMQSYFGAPAFPSNLATLWAHAHSHAHLRPVRLHAHVHACGHMVAHAHAHAHACGHMHMHTRHM